MKISNATRHPYTVSAPQSQSSKTVSQSAGERCKEIAKEVDALWNLFVKVRGSVSCRLIEAIVTSASSASGADITPTNLPSIQADLDWDAFEEYVGKWLQSGNSLEVMVDSFRHFRSQFTTHVYWEFEIESGKYESFDPQASMDLERHYIEGVGDCLLETAVGGVHEVDLDDRVMYGDKSEVKLRRRVELVKVSEAARAGASRQGLTGENELFLGEEDSQMTHDNARFDRQLPTSNTVVSWTYRPHKASSWQHLNRFQSFSIERAYRDSMCADVFTCEVGGEPHTIVTVDTVVPTAQLPENGVDYVRRGPHIMRSVDYIPAAHKQTSLDTATSEKYTNNRYSLIRRIIVPRDRAHHSDVLWRADCPVVYAAQALHEKRPAMARAFRELEAKGEVSLVAVSLDDDDRSLFLLAKELIDVWAVPPMCITIPRELCKYEVLIEGMFVPLIPINNWIMLPGTIITPCGESNAERDITSLSRERCEKTVFLFKQWLKYDPATCTILLPINKATSTSADDFQQHNNKCNTILWCRLAEEKDSVVRFVLKNNTPWICDREFMSLHSAMPRKFLEANVCVECPDIDAEDAKKAMAWALGGFKGKLQDYGVLDVEAVVRAAKYLGFDKKLTPSK